MSRRRKRDIFGTWSRNPVCDMVLAHRLLLSKHATLQTRGTCFGVECGRPRLSSLCGRSHIRSTERAHRGGSERGSTKKNRAISEPSRRVRRGRVRLHAIPSTLGAELGCDLPVRRTLVPFRRAPHIAARSSDEDDGVGRFFGGPNRPLSACATNSQQFGRQIVATMRSGSRPSPFLVRV